MEKKRHSKESKLAILKEVESKGVEIMLRKHGIYPSTYYHWRKQYRQYGEQEFLDTARKVKDQQYVRRLEDELSLLKELLAEKEMEIALRDELLKKKYPWARKKI